MPDKKAKKKGLKIKQDDSFLVNPYGDFESEFQLGDDLANERAKARQGKRKQKGGTAYTESNFGAASEINVSKLND